MSNIHEAVYVKSDNPDFEDHPLIEALPRLNDIKEYFQYCARNSIHTREEAIGKPYHIRRDYLSQLQRDFVLPNYGIWDVYQMIVNALFTSYSFRNPIKQNTTEKVIRDYRDLLQIKDLSAKVAVSNSCSLFGISGIGKTTAVNLAISTFPKAILHKNLECENFIQIPIVKVECPKDGSLKDLCRNFFVELDKILGDSTYEKDFCKKRDSESDRINALSKLVLKHHIGIIIVDEIQNLDAQKSGGEKRMLRFFLNLDNTLDIPIMLVGTRDGISIFKDDDKLIRRFTAAGFLEWNPKPEDREWERFIQRLFLYQYTKEKADENIDWPRLFYHYSQGIYARAFQIFKIAHHMAFDYNKEKITVSLINQVIKERLYIDEPLFEIRRKEKINESNYDFPIEEIDYTDYRSIEVKNILVEKKISSNFFKGKVTKTLDRNKELSAQEIADKIILDFTSKPKKTNTASKEKDINKEEEVLSANTFANLFCEDKDETYQKVKEFGDIFDFEKFSL
ncbi:AAA family ATPase [Marivirga salinae]|uniref:AAA family ATPase n=1 Tax=Marivirga salinarum TaxID=3059078 RepID=A0AA49GCF8_9BACT|nr:AAA family ATPase [Marivirga sp. BDSF4-3]WKK77095.2 AAA family ATPase [Marivirga sp. BDSF4-3]